MLKANVSDLELPCQRLDHTRARVTRGWARHRLGNPTNAEDLLQDLFLKALRLCATKSRIQRPRLRMKARMTVACQVQLDDAGHVLDFVPRAPV